VEQDAAAKRAAIDEARAQLETALMEYHDEVRSLSLSLSLSSLSLALSRAPRSLSLSLSLSLVSLIVHAPE
jgi:hypothetical protein